MSEDLNPDAVAEAWKSQISEEYRETPLIGETKSLDDLAKQALDFQRMMGSMIRIPGEDAGDEARRDFRDKLAKVGMVPLDNFGEYVRPKEADHYKLSAVPADANDLGLTQGQLDQWKDEAWADGLSEGQFNQRVQRAVDGMRYNRDKAKAEYQTKEAALKDEWGMYGYEPNKQRAMAAALRFGGQQLFESLRDSPDPTVMKAFGEIGKQFEEQGMGDLQQPLSLPETKDEAEIKLNEILNNPKSPFNAPSEHPRQSYDAQSREVMRLRRIMMGEPAGSPDDLFAA